MSVDNDSPSYYPAEAFGEGKGTSGTGNTVLYTKHHRHQKQRETDTRREGKGRETETRAKQEYLQVARQVRSGRALRGQRAGIGEEASSCRIFQIFGVERLLLPRSKQAPGIYN